MLPGIDERSLFNIQPWYRYRIERLEKCPEFNGSITMAHCVSSELILFEDKVAPRPDHITMITGLRSTYDEIIYLLKSPFSTKLKNTKSMTFLVPNGMNVSE